MQLLGFNSCHLRNISVLFSSLFFRKKIILTHSQQLLIQPDTKRKKIDILCFFDMTVTFYFYFQHFKVLHVINNEPKIRPPGYPVNRGNPNDDICLTFGPDPEQSPEEVVADLQLGVYTRQVTHGSQHLANHP